jgi:hypothetical protein
LTVAPTAEWPGDKGRQPWSLLLFGSAGGHKGVIMAIAVVVLVAVVAGGLLGSSEYYQLMRHGTTTTGVVTRIDHGNHCQVDYAFEALGRTYSNLTSDCALLAGAQVKVYYLPSKPTVSTIDPPRSRLFSTLLDTGIVALVMGFLIVRNRRPLLALPKVLRVFNAKCRRAVEASRHG